MRRILATITLLLTFLATPCVAQVTVKVSPEYRSIYSVEEVLVEPRKINSIRLDRNYFRDRYQVFFDSSSSISFIVLDGRDAEADNPNPTPLLRRNLVGKGSFVIETPPSNSGAIASLLNSNSYPAKVNLRIDRIGTRPESIRKQIRNIVDIPFRSLSVIYDLPPITVTVRPCGQINAFSSPDITVCTELMADLDDKGVPNALLPILLHELAHSLLYIWKIPGYEDEKLADEFAVVLLSKASPESIEDLIRWFEKQDSISENIIRLVATDKHPLSLQRALTARQILQNPDKLFVKWGKVLGPHMRKEM
jgi:hypothetical protein